MNLKPFFIALILTCLSITVFGQYNYKQKLGNLATIAFPDSPKMQRIKGSDIYTLNKNGVIFVAQAGDVQGGLRDLLNSTKADSIYNGYIGGMIESTKGKLFYKDKIKINGHDGIEFGYSGMLKGQMVYRYHHAVYLNDTILMCGIMSSDSLAKDEQHLKAFFDGFKVRSTQQLSDASANQMGYKTGKVIGMLAVLSIPVLIGLGIVFLIRKLVYKKNRD
jgi:hypothetical protein